MKILGKGKALLRSSKLLPFHPLMDEQGLLRVGGRTAQTRLSYSRRHPLILPGDNPLVRLIVRTEHVRLLHAGPTLVAASLSRRFCIVRGRRMIRAEIYNCVTCKCVASTPKPQILGQLPMDRINLSPVFERVGVDNAGPTCILTKSGPVRKPTYHKPYITIFMCFVVKAVHLEAVSDLTIAAFMAALCRFIA